MPRNYFIEAKGLAFWKETERTITFNGEDHKVTFAQLRPERIENVRVRVIDDHTVELTISDPNNLV
jgi:hypothetical protein